MLVAVARDGAVCEEVEFGDEHGGHAVEGGGFVGAHGFERGEGVEGFFREDDGRAVGCGRHVAQDAAEAAGVCQPVCSI